MIGELIKKQRVLLGLSGVDLARAAGVSHQSLWHYEHGTPPPKDKLFRIAAALLVAFLHNLGIKAIIRETLTETRILMQR